MYCNHRSDILSVMCDLLYWLESQVLTLKRKGFQEGKSARVRVTGTIMESAHHKLHVSLGLPSPLQSRRKGRTIYA